MVDYLCFSCFIKGEHCHILLYCSKCWAYQCHYHMESKRNYKRSLLSAQLIIFTHFIPLIYKTYTNITNSTAIGVVSLYFNKHPFMCLADVLELCAMSKTAGRFSTSHSLRVVQLTAHVYIKYHNNNIIKLITIFLFYHVH